MKRTLTQSALIAALLLCLEQTSAVEFEKLGSAVAKALKTKQAVKTSVKVGSNDVDVFYAKDASGKANHLAVIQKRIYEPNCTHTWVIGVNATNAKVENIRVVEMSCPHAFPTNKPNFLDQFKGKGPVDAKALKASVQTIAKATGSCNLTTDAVVTAISAANSLKGKI